MAKILIVDDEQINLDFFEVMLTKLGFDVVKADDGEEALETVQEEEPNLIVLDNIMPRLSGWEVTRILKQEEEYRAYSRIPIIMFSAMDDVKDKIEGFELGVEDYITKPFNFSEVLARIKAVLRNHELGQQVEQRERRIELTEAINSELISFVRNLRVPLERLRNDSESCTSGDQALGVVRQAGEIAQESLAQVRELEEKIDSFIEQGDELRATEVTLDDLDLRYQRHIQNLKENADAIDEARS
ncbi:MAG: response regulator transcription factor [Spirochaetales bacterium]